MANGFRGLPGPTGKRRIDLRPPYRYGGRKHNFDEFEPPIERIDQQAFGQVEPMQTGVRKASYHLPSIPQTFIVHEPLAHFAAHIMAETHAVTLWCFFFAASDGAAEMAIAIAATALTSRNFERCFIASSPRG
jgi:hypothetical protein